jgi:aryl-alcohol dehydrogenase-like predicted oxidoreductase
MKSKLALGTVQFGIPYGINNTMGIPSSNELNLIFSTARLNGIQTFDTAIAYGHAEEQIRPFLFEGAQVISKFPSASTPKSLALDLSDSLKRLGQNQLYAFIAHDADLLLKKPKLWTELIRLQADELIIKKGYSLYYPEQLEKLLEIGYIPDLIQVPFSLLDRRFDNAIKKLHDMGVEIHVRSVFLQGLYFMNVSKLPSKLQAISSELKQLHDLAQSENVSISELALNFVTKNIDIDKVVIGVDSSEQLQINIRAVNLWNDKKNTIFDNVKQLNCSKPELLIPSNWK